MHELFHILPLSRRATPTALLALPTFSTTSSGNTFSEFWPEVDVYYGIDARSRVLFTADATRSSEGFSENRELNGRARFDARSVDGEPSQRDRARIGLDGSTTVEGVSLGPFTDAEASCDTRYNRRSRTLFRAGSEVVIAPNWRIEPCAAVQAHRSSGKVARVVALRLALKYSH